MKLKGEISIHAQDALHRKFLPALERMGKTVRIVIDPDQVMFVQMQEEGTEGGLVKLEMPTSFIFEGNYTVQSNHNNKVAFSCHVGVLLKVFAAASTIDAVTMVMQLTTIPKVADGAQLLVNADGSAVRRPVLRFTCKGLQHASVQDVPIDKPLTAAAIDEIAGCLMYVGLSEWYLRIGDHVPKIEALLQVVSRQDAFVRLVTSKAGELHVQVESEFRVQGMELQPLPVVPPFDGATAAQTAATATERLAACMACDEDDCPRAEVLTKSLTRALAAATLATSDMLLLSCGDSTRQVVHIMCTFTDGSGTMEDYALSVWLPTRATDDD